MTLEDIYFIASIFAAFSVVVSLIFVGLQVRQSNRQSEREHISQSGHDAGVLGQFVGNSGANILDA